MNYAIDYQIVGDSVVISWEDKEKPEVFLLKGLPGDEKTKKGLFKARRKRSSAKAMAEVLKVIEKNEFIGFLSAKDIVWLELGGATDRFALACLKQGAQVFHTPTYLIKQAKEQRRKSKENSAQIIYRWVQGDRLEKFYQLREIDRRYLEVARLVKSYRLIQRKMRIPTEQRFRYLEQDLEFIGSDPLAIELKKLWQDLEKVAVPDRLKVIEKSLKGELAERLEELPLYQEIFKPISGIAEVTAGLIIAGILDIRRFQKLSQLRKMFGAHLVKDPETKEWRWPRKRKGQPREGNPLLIDAVQTFLEQQRLKKLDPIWQEQFDKRLEYEKTKIPQILAKEYQKQDKELPEEPEKREKLFFARARANARHWLAQKFVQYIWYQWRRFEGIGEA